MGRLKAHPPGVFDLYGNLNEWVQDWYDPRYYGESLASDPTGPGPTGTKVVRGGGYDVGRGSFRLTDRRAFPPTTRDRRIGFRVIRVSQ